MVEAICTLIVHSQSFTIWLHFASNIRELKGDVLNANVYLQLMLVEIKHIHPQMLMGYITVKPEKQNCWLKQNIQIHSGMKCSLYFTFNCLLVSMMSYAFCSPQNSQWLLCTGTESPIMVCYSNRGTCSSTAALNLHTPAMTTLWKVCSESTTIQQDSPGTGFIPPPLC